MLSEKQKTSPDAEQKKSILDFPPDCFKKFAFIDVKENSGNTWIIGKIMERNTEENIIKIRCEGMRQELKLKPNSDRIAPFRIFTKGFANMRCCLVSNMNMTDELFEEFFNLILELSNAENIQKIKPFFITQNLRGNFFYYFDILLAKGSDDATNMKIFSAFALFIKFAASYLVKFESCLANFYQGIINPYLALENSEIAYALSIFEILESLWRLFSPKFLETYKDYDYMSAEVYDYICSFSGIRLNLDSDSPTLASLFYFLFYQNKGISNLKHLILLFPFGADTDNIFYLPSVWKLLDLLLTLQKFFFENARAESNEEEKKMRDAHLLVFNSLKQLTDREIKELDKEMVLRILRNLQAMEIVCPEELDILELEIYRKYLFSQFFEKKLKALNDLKDFLEKIKIDERKNNARTQTPEKAIRWLLDQKIIENLIKNSSQIDLIKRGFDLIRYILKSSENFPLEVLNLLWTSMEDSNYEDIQMCFQDFIEELSVSLDQESLNFLYKKIYQSLQENKLNIDNYFNFLKKFIFHSTLRTKTLYVELKEFLSQKTVELESQGSQEEIKEENNKKDDHDALEESDDKYIGLQILWQLVQDESNLAHYKVSELLDLFRELLTKLGIDSLLFHYLKLAISKLTSGTSLYQSTFIIQRILIIISEKIELKNFLETLKIHYGSNLAQIIIDSMIRLHSETQNRSKFDFTEIYKIQLSLLSLIRKYSQMVSHALNQQHFFQVSKDSIQKLFSLSLTSPFYQNQPNDFWDNFKMDHELNGPLFTLFSRFIDMKLINGEHIPPNIPNCFFNIFSICNSSAKKFEAYSNCHYAICEEQEILGFETLWSLFKSLCLEFNVELCINLIINCYCNLGEGLWNHRWRIWNDFFEKCFNILKQAIETRNKPIVQRTIKLLDYFTIRLDNKNNFVQKGDNTIFIRNVNEKGRGFYMLNHDYVKFLKIRICEENNINEDEFEIISHKMDKFDNKNKISELSINGEILYRIIKENNRENVLAVVSDKKEFLQVFFSIFENEISDDISISAWNLIFKFPLNKEIEKNFLQISDDPDKKDDLIECLSTKNTFELKYYFQYFLKFFKDFKNKEIYSKWFTKFKPVGLKSFPEILKTLVSKKIQTSFQKNLLKNFLKILSYFIINYNSLKEFAFYSDLPPEDLSLFTESLISCLVKTTDYAIYREENDLEKCQQGKCHFKMIPFQCRDYLEFFKSEKEIADLATNILLELFSFKNESLAILFNFSQNEEFLFKILFENDNRSLKEVFTRTFLQKIIYDSKSKCKLSEELNIAKKHFGDLLFYVMLKRAKEANFYDCRQEDYFDLYLIILNNITLEEFKNFISVSIDEISYLLINFIVEANTNQDVILFDYLKILNRLIVLDKENLSSSKFNLVEKIANKFIFFQNKEITSAPSGQKENFLNKNTIIDIVFRIIKEAFSISNEALHSFLDNLTDIMKGGNWRSNKKNSWDYNPILKQKSLTGYVGLKNLGCTCYMNSVLQQLYMIPNFRKAIIEINDENAILEEEEENILSPMKEIFTQLLLSDKQYVSTKKLCQAFRDENGNPVCVSEQKDAFEFFSLLTEKLEKFLKKSPYSGLYKSTFEGVLSNQLICQGCPHSSERDEPFLGLNIEVKNKKHLLEGLSKLIESELLEGDNAYFCEQCNKKVDTIKRVIIKELPNHLLFVLKRFEFDFDTFSKVKINDFYEFPSVLNMKSYTINNNQNDSYFEYILSGIIIHMGIADAGHYYSLTHDRYNKDGRWIEFNDTNAKYFDPMTFGSEAFGYDERMNNGNCVNRFKNAYILIYDRSFGMQNHSEADHIFKTTEISVNALRRDQLKEENRQIVLHKILFNKEFFSLFDATLDESGDLIEEDRLRKVYCAIDYFLFVVARAYEKNSYLYRFFCKIKELLEKNVILSKWFLKVFTNSAVFKEFFFENSCPDIRSMVLYLLKTSIQNVCKNEKGTLFDVCSQNYPNSVLSNFINFLIDQLNNAIYYPNYITYFFQLFNFLSNLNRETVFYLLKNEIIGRFLNFFYDRNIEEIIENEFLDSPQFPQLKFREISATEIKTGGFASSYFQKYHYVDHNRMNNIARMNLEYFWKTITDLLDYCQFDDSSQDNNELNYTLTKFEAIVLKVMKTKFFTLVWENSNTSKGAIAIGKIYAFAAKNENEFSNFLKKSYCHKILGSSKENEIRYFLKGFYYFLILNDDLKKLRIETTLLKFFECFKSKHKGSKNYNFMEMIFKFFERASRKEFIIHSFLQDNNVYSFLLSYCQEILRANPEHHSKMEYKQLKMHKKTFKVFFDKFERFQNQKEITISSDSDCNAESDSNESLVENKEIYYIDRVNNKKLVGRIEESFDNLLKIKIEYKDPLSKTRTYTNFLILDKDCKNIKMKESNENDNNAAVFSSNSENGRNSEELETCSNKSRSERTFNFN